VRCAVWSPKGGSGTSVVAAALSLQFARRAPTTLIDLAGDQTALLDVPVPGAGIGDWIAAGAARESFAGLGAEVTPQLRLVPSGAFGSDAGVHEADEVVHAVGGRCTVVDAGTRGTSLARHMVERCASVLVIEPCYLALHRSTRDDQAARADVVVLVQSPERVLTARDVEGALGRPVVVSVPRHASIARAVDAGVLAHRLPDVLDRPIRRLLHALLAAATADGDAV